MNTLYGMQQGLIHAYVSKSTCYSTYLLPFVKMKFACWLTCVVFWTFLTAPTIWLWRSSETTNGIVIFFSIMQFRIYYYLINVWDVSPVLGGNYGTYSGERVGMTAWPYKGGCQRVKGQEGYWRRLGEGPLSKSRTRQSGRSGIWPKQNRAGWGGSVTALCAFWHGENRPFSKMATANSYYAERKINTSTWKTTSCFSNRTKCR